MTLATGSIFLVSFFLLSLVGGGWVKAGTLTFAWDRPRMADGAAIPCEAHLLYRVHWGPTPRPASPYTYPNRTPRTPLLTATVSAPTGATRCFTVSGYLARAHTWEVDGVTYSLAAGEGVYGQERCVRVP